MVLVRNVFHLKFGQVKEAVSIWKEIIDGMRTAGFGRDHRLLTDLAGVPYYTLIFEVVFPSVGEWETALGSGGARSSYQPLYQRFIPLVESGQREIFTIVE